ncbi:hypothetical protein GGR57DRAFT_140838 [Xylariaceae sp. FL1272]|nr:hypothetical protein GGR57DRAFT_140838 [Xylariaceae sp. FL1272]
MLSSALYTKSASWSDGKPHRSTAGAVQNHPILFVSNPGLHVDAPVLHSSPAEALEGKRMTTDDLTFVPPMWCATIDSNEGNRPTLPSQSPGQIVGPHLVDFVVPPRIRNDLHRTWAKYGITANRYCKELIRIFPWPKSCYSRRGLAWLWPEPFRSSPQHLCFLATKLLISLSPPRLVFAICHILPMLQIREQTLVNQFYAFISFPSRSILNPSIACYMQSFRRR